jgi:hypothetical protein
MRNIIAVGILHELEKSKRKIKMCRHASGELCCHQAFYKAAANTMESERSAFTLADANTGTQR